MIANRHCMDKSCRSYELTVSPEEARDLWALLNGKDPRRRPASLDEMEDTLARVVNQAEDRGLLE